MNSTRFNLKFFNNIRRLYLALFALLALSSFASAIFPGALSLIVNPENYHEQQDFKLMNRALTQFFNDYGRFPEREEGLAILVEPSEFIPERQIVGDSAYLSELPRDPWGDLYSYRKIIKAQQEVVLLHSSKSGKLFRIQRDAEGFKTLIGLTAR